MTGFSDRSRSLESPLIQDDVGRLQQTRERRLVGERDFNISLQLRSRPTSAAACRVDEISELLSGRNDYMGPKTAAVHAEREMEATAEAAASYWRSLVDIESK